MGRGSPVEAHREADRAATEVAGGTATSVNQADQSASQERAAIAAPRRYGTPNASYRLQLQPSFGFAEARDIIPYLSSLGVTHVYVSPIFAAAPGSTHGYDVFDHSKINPELGGIAGLYAFGEALIEHQMGLILDIVPNHVGIAGGANPWWRSVLRYGEASPYAANFDIDWQAQPHMPTGVLVFAILGRPFGRALEAGELQLGLDGAELVVRYFDQALPLRPESYPRVLGLPPLDLRARLMDPVGLATVAGILEDLGSGEVERCEAATAQLRGLLGREPAIEEWAQESVARFDGVQGEPATWDALDTLLDEQHYRLADWRVAGAEVNYRRFFDQNSLAAIRIEREDVFTETHRLLFDLAARGIVTGVRVDHIDGLYAPGDYLERLRSGLAKAAKDIPGAEIPIYVEKILQDGEELPCEWPVAGTTGYEAMAHIDRLLVDPEGARQTTRTYEQLVGPGRYETARYEAKRYVVRNAFAGEISVLAYQAHRIAQRNRLHRDNTLRALRDAIEGMVACFPVYRTYVEARARATADAGYIAEAIDEAGRRNRNLPDASLDFLWEVLLLDDDSLPEEEREQRLHFRRRLQQITGPVMAKGLEDTTFFRYNRLISLNEVGGDPSIFGADPGVIHAWLSQRAREWPRSMTATSTHDTKRNEDVRARINLLSELPREWRREVMTWARMNERHLRTIDGERAPSPNLEYYLYQTLVGSWPKGGVDAIYRERVAGHLVKAMRERKMRTSWDRPNEDYEAACLAFAERILTPRHAAAFLRRLDGFVERLQPAAHLNSLAALTMKCLSPGFPDFYQGTELFELTLTDPDNRRPIDFRVRKEMLGLARQFDPRVHAPTHEYAKPWLTQALLDLRARHRGALLDGDYVPLQVTGPAAANAFAFSRAGEVVAVVPRLVTRLTRGEGSPDWGNTAISLPGDGWRNAFTKEPVEGSRLAMSSLPALIPLAVLERG